MTKPIPASQARDPRAFQISQLKRRFSPTEIIGGDGTLTLTFNLPPSDPDFPFDLPNGLECVLHVPPTYAAHGDGAEKPRLEVRNEEMGEQWRQSIESGFGRLVNGMGPNGTLLGLMNRLDKGLESLLTEKTPDLVTIVPNKTKNLGPGPVGQPSKDTPRMIQPDKPFTKPSRTYTPEQLQVAAQRRETETRQLEARLGRLPGFSKSSDGIAYTLSLTPRKVQDLPQPLRIVKTVILFVPLLYSLQHCRVELQDVSKDVSRNVERAFERKAKLEDGTLTALVNMLAQNMHLLAAETFEDETKEAVVMPHIEELKVDDGTTEKANAPDDSGRAHIIVIPRPPEWDAQETDDISSESGDSDSDSGSYDSDDEETVEKAEDTLTAPSASASTLSETPERGISLSFPHLELYSIELLELVSLSITIKCSRCKDIMDINNLRTVSQRSASCKKCASPLSISFRRELIHANANRAGYLDLEGCTVVDMLPSNFLPTCSQCSITHAAPGVVSVRGASTMAICRECHAKMTFKIPETKFLLISSATRSGGPPLRKKKPKENLGITVGQELPRRGRCQHYTKSYRWFRFSCCERVFPCDRCHDEASDHPNEHANRMICGFCSREQNYRPEDCAVCKASVIKKAGGGFWEGGKGTRDKVKMSRKGRLRLPILVLVWDLLRDKKLTFDDRPKEVQAAARWGYEEALGWQNRGSWSDCCNITLLLR